MSGRKISRYIFVSLLSFVLISFPISFSFFLNFSSAQIAPNETITRDVVWSENRVVTGIVTVQSGATLTIKKGVIIEFDGQAKINVSGKLSLEGTPSQPIVLKKMDADMGDYYSITALSLGSIMARNINVSGGGNASQVFMAEGNRNDSLLQYTNAYWMYAGTFGTQGGGTLDIEGARFHDNALAILNDSYPYNKTKVWRSKFSGNNLDYVNYGGAVASDMRYNWWGNMDGPERCLDTNECDYGQVYKKVLGKADVSDWAKEENFKDPVIVIPGIMGSWKMTQKSALALDPVFGTYDDLLETLGENGYTIGENLFPFPYEWHYSNVETAKLLKTKIDEIKAQTKWPKVDIVAHSMGGLVAREYVGTLNGSGNVDQLITLGTPHNGSPESYLAWEDGSFTGFRGFFANKIFQQEAEENKYASIFEYIRKAPITSIRELLPVYSYLRDKGSGELRTYPNLYPINTFLQNLKTPTNVSRLAPVAFTNIVGKTNKNDTLEKIRVDGASIELLNNPEAVVLWGHGEPDGYSDFFGGDRGLELGIGDGTVPLDSAKNIEADETIEIENSHSDLPSAAAKIVFQTLTGTDVKSDVLLTSTPANILLFMPFSPIDVQVVSPSGLRVGKNFETGEILNEIPGAYYTGYDTQNEFVTISNPEKGEYRILTQGIGVGDYRVEAVNIQEDASGKAIESIATIHGMAELNKNDESAVELKETGEVVLVGSEDVVAPITTATFSGIAGTNDWYVSDVSATLTAEDNKDGSGVKKTDYSLDNGTNWIVYTHPVVISQEGTITLQYFSTDNQGNKEEIQTKTIKIDRVVPEAKIVFNPITQKLDIIGTDNLSNVVSITTENKTIFTDEAGHTLVLTLALEEERDGENKEWDANKRSEEWKKKDTKTFVVLQSLVYDGREQTLQDTMLRYEWEYNQRKNVYTMFGTNARVSGAIIESKFQFKNNITTIMQKQQKPDDREDNDFETRAIRQRLSGLVISYLQTEKGQVKIGY